MSKSFLLFAERSFEDYAQERFDMIVGDIERMSDIELLMYKDSFEVLLKNSLRSYRFKPVEVSFENKVVDLIWRNTPSGNRVFVEYSLSVSGDLYNLGLIPRHPSGFELPVCLKTNVLSFEIDSRHHNEELSAGQRKLIKKDYDEVKCYINDCVFNLNQTISFYNAELEKFLIPLRAGKLRRAQNSCAVRESLNF